VSEPRITVLIPVHNGERYLAEAIESALSQRPQPCEVIVIDDGSSDASLEVASRFSPSVRCLSHSNGGVSRARNSGVATSDGNYLAFLDADDVWTPGALGALVARLIGDPELDLVFGRVREFVTSEPQQDRRGGLTARPGLLQGFLPGSMLIRRSAFEAVGGFREDVRSGEFLDWIARSRDLGLREIQIDDHVVWRRIHGGNHGLRRMDARVDYARVLKSALDRRRAAAGQP
jgi:glycosyltransferase involved in cell wall biosynthesis